MKNKTFQDILSIIKNIFGILFEVAKLIFMLIGVFAFAQWLTNTPKDEKHKGA